MIDFKLSLRITNKQYEIEEIFNKKTNKDKIDKIMNLWKSVSNALD